MAVPRCVGFSQSVLVSSLGLTLPSSSSDAKCADVVPRQWFVTEHVREKFSCRSCETITQPPAPFHAIARGFAGPSLLAMMLVEKYANHQPLNRQSEQYAREGIELSVSNRWRDHRVARGTCRSPVIEAAPVSSAGAPRVVRAHSVAHPEGQAADRRRYGDRPRARP